jgi:hypothetical protein
MKDKNGHGRNAIYKVGDVVVRTRHKRGGECRQWVKVAEPNSWRLLCQHVWEQHNGCIPRGFVIHHRDRDKMNDDISNLALMTKGQHVNEHRSEYEDRRIEASRRACLGRT